jgi:hypothetical protein
VRRAALVAAALAGLAGPTSSAAAAEGFQLYPLRSVYYAAPAGAAAKSDLIDPDFRAAVGDAERAYFEEAFRKRFPDAAKELLAKGLRRTMAVSLQVARASRYTVKKADGTVDALLPVTASLYFTNVGNGEVLYAQTETLVAQAQLLPDQARAGAPKVKELFRDTYRELVDELVEGAGKRFKPLEITAKVRDRWNGYLVLDAGAEAGLQPGDSLLDDHQAELQVVSVAPRYAVAKVLLGPASEGPWRKLFHGTLADVKKPRVLPVVDRVPAWFPESAAVQLFSDALGTHAPVSLVPVNPTFQAVLHELANRTVDFSSEKLHLRQLPAFFVRLHVPDPISFERTTNLSQKTLRVTETLAWAELVDESGRILFTALGRDTIEDEITEGMGLSLPARREVAVKNALLALAKEFAALKVDRLELPLSAKGGALTVQDDRGALAPGATVIAYRPTGKGDVIAPIAELSVAELSGATATLSVNLPLVDGVQPKDGDRIVLDGVAARRATQRRLGPCGEAENLGGPALPGLSDLALNRLAAGYAAPIYGRGLAAAVRGLVERGAGFEKDARLTEPPVDLCVLPVYKVDLLAPECNDQYCTDVATLGLSYRVKRGGEVVAKNGLAQRLKARALPPGSSDAVRKAALQADLWKQLVEIAPAAAGGLTQQKF